MPDPADFSADVLRIDAAAEVDRIATWLRSALARDLKRRGVVVALSGGIDSSVVGALCVKALGAERVFGLFMPERESCSDTHHLGHLIAEHLGIEWVEEDITPILAASRCYERRDQAIRTVIPQYAAGYRCKIVLPSVIDADRLRVFSVVVESPEGEVTEARLPHAAYLTVVAASNFKQRTRKMLEYYHADRRNFAVAGTPNRLEYDQGFFVKGGDGLADVKPIAHLYKTQVYQLAEWLGLPEAIRRQSPTTDTYPMPQSQEEFFFSLPYDTMDLCLHALDHGVSAARVAKVVGLKEEQVERVFRDIGQKRRTAAYLHLPAALVDPDISF